MNKRVEAKADYLGTSPFLGLTEEEASLRVKAGLSNAPKRNEGKGYWAILKNNVCDLFTLFLFAIAILFFVYSRVLISNGYEEEAARYFGFSKYLYLLPLVFNILWIMTGWWEIAIFHIVMGILCAITIIGIPFAKAHWRLLKMSILPFGSTRA